MTGKFAWSLVLAGGLVSCGGKGNPRPQNASDAAASDAAAAPAQDEASSAPSGAEGDETAGSPDPGTSEGAVSDQIESDGTGSDAVASDAASDSGAPPPSDDLQSYVGGGAYTPEYRTVTENMGVIKQCYLDAIRADPDIQGMLKVRFTVNKAGKAIKATALQNELNDQVEKCVLAEIKKLKFPKRSDNRTVEYPFKFMPAP